MKVVINRCFGGFGLSEKAYEFLDLEWDGYGYTDLDRNDPKLVECVESLGDEADGRLADLVVVDIPDGIEWTITNYDGAERVEEKHRSWY